ncbi:hypothetical protein [Pseudoalteromonas sp. 20-MNA-CIBAN-0454]|uniref:hypothetical protein n=1 Tax=Pseudoalteromonas sp. 20-MNA-CIBAN-0454 TaxID=3140424 RepID=UPI00331ED50A
MKKITYLSLEKNVLINGIGGASHIKGVISTLLIHYNVTYMGHATHFLKGLYDNLSFQECGRRFYWDVLKAIFTDNETDVFLIRKTLVGMYLLIPIILLKKIIRPKQVFILEFNGISGDYSGKSIAFSRVMLFFNALPLIFYDGVYCVLDDIANRLKSVYNSRKIFVCPNGGPKQSKKMPNITTCERVNLIYYGSDLAHYHLHWCASKVDEYNKETSADVRLILVGPYNENVIADCVKKVSARPAKEFQSFVASLDGKVFGLVPLNLSESSNTIEPIKTFDYLSANLPIIHSSACLNGFDSAKVCFMYKPDKPDSFSKLLNEITALTPLEVKKLYKSVFQEYTAYTWPNRLKKLVEVIDHEDKKRS